MSVEMDVNSDVAIKVSMMVMRSRGSFIWQGMRISVDEEQKILDVQGLKNYESERKLKKTHARADFEEIKNKIKAMGEACADFQELIDNYTTVYVLLYNYEFDNSTHPICKEEGGRFQWLEDLPGKDK